MISATATYAQFMKIVIAENNPQILYAVDRAGKVSNVHVRSWGGIVLTLLEAPTEADFEDTYCYARKIESLG